MFSKRFKHKKSPIPSSGGTPTNNVFQKQWNTLLNDWNQLNSLPRISPAAQGIFLKLAQDIYNEFKISFGRVPQDLDQVIQSINIKTSAQPIQANYSGGNNIKQSLFYSSTSAPVGFNGFNTDFFNVDEAFEYDDFPTPDVSFLKWASYQIKDGNYQIINDGILYEVNKLRWDALIMAKIPIIKFNAPAERAKLLQYYIDIFDEIPSGSHMIRAYSLMEKIILEKFANAEITIDEKGIEKFDKLKNLALNNENINERKLAFFNSVKLYRRLAELKLSYPGE